MRKILFLMVVLGFFFLGSILVVSAKTYTFQAKDGSTIQIFAKDGKFHVIDRKGRSRIKPQTSQPPAGYSVSKTTGGYLILLWYACWDHDTVMAGKRACRFRVVQYQWDGSSFVPTGANVTDSSWMKSQHEEILEELNKKDTEFLRAFRMLQKYIKEHPNDRKVKKLSKKKITTLNLWHLGGKGYIYEDGGVTITIGI